MPNPPRQSKRNALRQSEERTATHGTLPQGSPGCISVSPDDETRRPFLPPWPVPWKSCRLPADRRYRSEHVHGFAANFGRTSLALGSPTNSPTLSGQYFSPRRTGKANVEVVIGHPHRSAVGAPVSRWNRPTTILDRLLPVHLRLLGRKRHVHRTMPRQTARRAADTLAESDRRL